MNKSAVNEGTQTRIFGTNPMVRKIERINERSETHVTITGIANKCLYFMLTLIAGIAAALILQNVGAKISLGSVEMKNFTLAISDVSVPGIGMMAAACLMMIFAPFFAFISKKTAAVLGSVYCFSTGYSLAFMTIMIQEYRAAIAIALIITIAICTAMFMLFRTGKINVTRKFRTVILSLVFAQLIAAVVLLVCAFIPALRFIPLFAAGNSMIAIVIGVIGIVIASLLLIVDFDAIARAVDNELPVEYEWHCAFGLAFSVIWLFLKVLDVVVKIMSKSRK